MDTVSKAFCRLSFLGLVLFLAAPLFAQDEIDGTFIRKYNLPGMHGGLDLAVTPDGGFVATGQHEGNGAAGDCDVYVYRVDECGNRLWLRLIGTGGQEGGKGIEATADGGFVIGGLWSGSGCVIKMSGDGTMEWAKSLSGSSWGHAAIGTSDGGYATLVKTSGHPALVKLDANGEVEWGKHYPNSAQIALRLIQLADDGFLIAANEGSNGRDLDVIRTDDEGEVVWSTSLGSGWSDADHTHWSANAVVDAAANRVYVTSPTQGGLGGEDILLAALSLSDGEVVWAKVYGGSNSDQSRDLVLTPNGIAVVGNTSSFPVPIESLPDDLTEPLGERDVLLFEVDLEGNLQWGRTYGGEERDKGIGVAYDDALGFTISAYSSSPVFGNEDSSHDPIFIRTDQEGFVNCQSATVDLEEMVVGVIASDLATAEPFNTTAIALNPTINSIEPEDIYQCQNCYSEPIFEFSSDEICVGESVSFYNTTNVGYTCFQEWELTGPTLVDLTFPGNLDTLEYVFDVPGDYTMELRSICNGVDQFFTIPLVVYDPQITSLTASDYNGYGVSCLDATDGWMIGQASGGLAEGSGYQWQWSNGSGWSEWTDGDVNGLGPGWWTAVVVDDLGCSDTAFFEMQAPPDLDLVSTVISDFNGFDVSCHDASDGVISISATGGAGNYSFSTEANGGIPSSGNLENLPSGLVALEVLDANGCIATANAFLNAPPPPAIGVSTTVDECESANGSIYADPNSAVGPSALAWNPASGDITESATTDAQTMNNLSTGHYHIAMTDPNGCTADTLVEVPGTSLPDPVLLAQPQHACLPDANVEVLDMTAGDIVWRAWDFGDGSDPVVKLGEFNDLVRHAYTESGDFSILMTVENADGCIASDSEFFQVDPDIVLFIPSSFTPNNDGSNDGFGPEGYGVKELHFFITTRWGEEVFVSHDMEWWWNGTTNNENLYAKQDVYVYTIEAIGLCDQVEQRHGIVTLLR